MLKVRKINDLTFIDSITGEPAAEIYFQGCGFKCKGCHNPELWPVNHREAMDLTPEDIVRSINRHKDFHSAVVLLGGEPLHQNLNDIAKLVEMLHNEGYKVVLYTGYDFEDIKSYGFLQYVDILKCGRYIEELKTDGFPASSNQRVYINEGGTFKDVTASIHSK